MKLGADMGGDGGVGAAERGGQGGWVVWRAEGRTDEWVGEEWCDDYWEYNTFCSSPSPAVPIPPSSSHPHFPP